MIVTEQDKSRCRCGIKLTLISENFCVRSVTKVSDSPVVCVVAIWPLASGHGQC